MPEIQFEEAMAAAWDILRQCGGGPVTPERLGCVTYTVLDAMYKADRRLARRKRRGCERRDGLGQRYQR